MSRKLKTPADPSIPLGTNKLASDTMFKERTLYTDSAYTYPGMEGDNFGMVSMSKRCPRKSSIWKS